MSDFTEFLGKLAPEGETFLLVRQKPQLKDNQYQFHADGAIKCTWPAMLPDAKVKPSWAIYGNTASFILDRFKDGYPSAQAANCEFVLVMVLDDVGTKATVPPLEPTWKMETSPGSFQWGYVFSEQPTKAETGYTFQVRRRKKYEAPLAISVSKETAFALGARKTMGEAVATFKIVPTYRRATPTQLRPSTLQRALFRPGKKPGEFVQKERFRIVTPGEVRQISYKGAAARRGGSKKGKWF